MKHAALKTSQRQSGLSLVEMMIGLVLGLIIVSGLFNTYLGSTRSSRFSQGLQEIQENGRYGITTLQRGIRLAGYTPDGDINAPLDVLNSNNNQIVVQLKDTRDCNGGLTTASNGIAVNTYAHNAADRTITCEGNSAGAQPMEVVEGIDAVRFLWGISTDGDEVPEQYIPYSATINPSEVVAMRVAILVSSSDPIRSRATQETHVLFDSEVPITPADKFARNVFTTTVKLRNKPKSNP